jgi:hypothetical protein
MKKTILTLIAALSMLTAFAQNDNNDNEDRNSRFGLKGGLNVSTLKIPSDKANEDKFRLGGNFGVFGYFGVASMFGVQVEALYNGKGTRVKKYSDSYGVTTSQVNFNLHYVEVPVFAKLNLGPIGIGAGLYASYLLNADISTISYRDDIPEVQRYKLNEDDFNTSDFGGLVDVSLNARSITAGVRYSEGFREVAKTNTGKFFLGDSKNALLSLYLGFSF